MAGHELAAPGMGIRRWNKKEANAGFLGRPFEGTASSGALSISFVKTIGIDGLKHVCPFWTFRIAWHALSVEVCLSRYMSLLSVNKESHADAKKESGGINFQGV